VERDVTYLYGVACHETLLGSGVLIGGEPRALEFIVPKAPLQTAISTQYNEKKRRRQGQASNQVLEWNGLMRRSVVHNINLGF
jgi:hypothetical protein